MSLGFFKNQGVYEEISWEQGVLRVGSCKSNFNTGEILNVLAHIVGVPNHILQKINIQFTHGQQGKFLSYNVYWREVQTISQ